MAEKPTARRERKQERFYACSICGQRRRFPSPEAANAHREKRHGDAGYIYWFVPGATIRSIKRSP